MCLRQMACLSAYVTPRRTWAFAHRPIAMPALWKLVLTGLAFGAGSQACGTDTAPIDIPRPKPAVTSPERAILSIFRAVRYGSFVNVMVAVEAEFSEIGVRQGGQ